MDNKWIHDGSQTTVTQQTGLSDKTLRVKTLARPISEANMWLHLDRRIGNGVDFMKEYFDEVANDNQPPQQQTSGSPILAYEQSPSRDWRESICCTHII